MGGSQGKDPDPNEAKDVICVLDDLDEILSDAKKKTELQQYAVAELKNQHAQQKRRQDTICLIKKICKEAEKDFSDIAKRFMEKWEHCKTINGDASRQGKNSPKGPAAKISKVAIQLYCAQKTDITDKAMRELEKKLTSEQFPQRMKLTVETCKTFPSIVTGIPLIVICLNSSRLGVDFSNAVPAIPDRSNTAVLIFHLLKEHALPTQPSSTVLSKAEVMSVGTIIDVAFLADIGLYDCEMNRSAYKALLTFIETHCKSSAGESESKEPERRTRQPPPPRARRQSPPLTQLSLPRARRPSPPPKPPASPALLSSPWRILPPLDSEQLSMLQMRLENYSLPSELNVTQARILMLGPLGAGKSSFNTINSIFQQSITGSAKGSVTLEYRSYEDRSFKTGSLLNFRSCEICVVENNKGPDLEDLNYLSEGSVPGDYKSSSASISPNIKECKHKAEARDEVHCVVFIFDADSIKATLQETWDKLQQLQKQMNTKRIPRVIILTNIDKLLESADNDVCKVFFSKDVKRAMEFASEKLRVPLGNVMPIKNYENEIDLNDQIKCLALLALDRMLSYAKDYLVDQHDLMKLSLNTTA